MEIEEPSLIPSAKVVLLGNSSCGKTSIVNRFIYNKFDHYSESTLGASFFTKVLDLTESFHNPRIKFHVWDTAGQEKYLSLAPMYYRGASAAILVFDICFPSTFEALASWMDKLNAAGPKGIIHIIVGNKCDLNDKRQVSRENAEAYASSNGAIYIEASARDDINVTQIFREIARILDKNHFTSSTGTSVDSVKLDDQGHSKSSCC